MTINQETHWGRLRRLLGECRELAAELRADGDDTADVDLAAQFRARAADLDGVVARWAPLIEGRA